MGLLDKIKNLLFEVEEIEIEDENITEVDSKSKDDPNIDDEPKTKKSKEEVDEMEDIISERDLFQSETTFKFPVIFEDEDFIVEKKNNQNPNILDYESSKLKEKPKKEEKQKFVVSPIISPVYGVLDKNYKKELSLKSKDGMKQEEKKQVINFDVVRQKAYGSLMDDIEDVLEEDDDNKGMFFNLQSENNNEKIDESNLLFDMSEKEEELTVQELIINDIEDDFIDHHEEEKEEPTESLKINTGDNLFDLIDSMYEKEGNDL
ncbi:MAG: hypothetical protein PHS45_00075 [Bacilli bacterium]|nr:hypothetical protein [Bacilli bacterium]